jgi:hypothetical protein
MNGSADRHARHPVDPVAQLDQFKAKSILIRSASPPQHVADAPSMTFISIAVSSYASLRGTKW